MNIDIDSVNRSNWTDLDDYDPSKSPERDIRTLFAYDFNPSDTFAEVNCPETSAQPCFNMSETIYTRDDSKLTKRLDQLFKEFTKSCHPTESIDIRLDEEQNHQSLPVVRSQTETSSKSLIPLSPSVAITNPHAKRLKLAHPLEDTYRPRYKSDYFPQSGPPRRPRYIADNVGHHFLTLQIPLEYHLNLEDKFLRVALITICIDGYGHFYSPLKFQIDHQDIQVHDQNPMYLPIKLNQDNPSMMKLQLVLIKAKLDQLNDVQPLKPFSDTITEIRNLIHEEKLVPKDLINKYQLTKSHIAFTVCTKLSDGSYKPHPESTLISSAISERSTSKTNNEGILTPAANICCPYCSNYFNVDSPDASDEDSQRQCNQTTARSCSKTTRIAQGSTKKKKKNS